MNFFKKIFHKKSNQDNFTLKENILSQENIEKASKIVSTYGNILEIYNDVCEPISILPITKKEIKDAIKMEYLFLKYYNNKGESYTEDDSKYKEGLGAVFVCLSNFVEDELSISYKKFSNTIKELTDPDNTNNESIKLEKMKNDANILKALEFQKVEGHILLQEWREWEIQVSNILSKISK